MSTGEAEGSGFSVSYLCTMLGSMQCSSSAPVNWFVNWPVKLE